MLQRRIGGAARPGTEALAPDHLTTSPALQPAHAGPTLPPPTPVTTPTPLPHPHPVCLPQASIAERRAASAAALLPDAPASSLLASQHAVAAAHAATRTAAAAAAGAPLPGSLAALALDHSYEGVSPIGTMEVLAIETAAAAAAGVTPPQGPMVGAAAEPPKPRGQRPMLPLNKISRPSLMACTEYTGVEHRHMEARAGGAAAPGAAAAGGVAGGAGGGSVPIPPEIATWLATLPPAGMLVGIPPVTAAAVEALCAELLSLPQSIGKAVPRPAGGRGGAGGGAAHGVGRTSGVAEWGGVPVPGVAARGANAAANVAACRGRDIYSARASMHQAEQPLRPPGAGY